MTTYILVHGGCHAAWCWEPVVSRLSSRGHQAVAVDLPGHAADAAAASTVTLDDYLDHVGGVVTAARAAGGPVVLVGHSMGGLTVTGVAERQPEAVTEAVFLSAIVPDPGSSAMAKLQEAAGTAELLEEGVLVPSEDGAALIANPDRAAGVFYNRCTPEVAAASVAQLGPEPILPMATPLALTDAGFGSVAKRYIGATDDRSVPPWLQQAIASRWGMPYEALDADHSSFLSCTDAVVERLVAVPS